MTNPNGHCSGDYISAITRCCHLKFLHALHNDPGYLAHPPTCTGVNPKKINREKLKFGLKLSVWASITSGIVGISSPKFSRWRGELWSTNKRGMGTNIDTADVLVHCKLTQFHVPRGSRARFFGVIRQVALLGEVFRIPKLTFHSELRRRAASCLALPCTSSVSYT